MKLKISHKLFLVIFITTAFSITVILTSQLLAFNHGSKQVAMENALKRLSHLNQGLARGFAQNNDWLFIAGKEHIIPTLVQLRRKQRAMLNGPKNLPVQKVNSSTASVGANSIKIGLYDINKKWIAGDNISNQLTYSKILLNGKIIGYLAVELPKKPQNEQEVTLAKKQLQNLFSVAILLFLIIFAAAYWLARHMSSPVKHLIESTLLLKEGQYDIVVPEKRADELGQLARTFNQLAKQLNNSQKMRNQWVADISHELRTPIAALQAELEMLEDGLQPLTPSAVSSLLSEVKSLGLMVNDLHQLSLSDEGVLSVNKERIDIHNLINGVFQTFEQRLRSHELSYFIEQTHGLYIWADKGRIRQLFVNLLENSARYTNKKGKILVSFAIQGDSLTICFEDSEPSVEHVHLPHLFDRLYRVDPSRNRATGASGLGLAICRSITEIHDGKIEAVQSELGGLLVKLTFPLYYED